MLLGNYFHNINKNYKNFSFSGISFDTKNIKKNNIFFAIKGIKFDGNNFIPKAIKKGSKVIISEKKIKEFKNGILFIHTKNIRKLLAEVSYKIYKNKPKNLIAVTGTNGKSSIANFYYQILKLNKKRVASIGTLGVKSNILNLNLSNTTIDPIQLGQILTKLKNQRINDVIKIAEAMPSEDSQGNKIDFGMRFANAYKNYKLGEDVVRVITPKNPEERGCQLSIQVINADKALHDKLTEAGVIIDWREPDVIRCAPVPLYNSFEDIYNLVERLKTILDE